MGPGTGLKAGVKAGMATAMVETVLGALVVLVIGSSMSGTIGGLSAGLGLIALLFALPVFFVFTVIGWTFKGIILGLIYPVYGHFMPDVGPLAEGLVYGVLSWLLISVFRLVATETELLSIFITLISYIIFGVAIGHYADRFSDEEDDDRSPKPSHQYGTAGGYKSGGNGPGSH
ncbi:MAG: hypothetical protein ABEK01_03755 [Candidatus Nanohaloarchaea archaeon]